MRSDESAIMAGTSWNESFSVGNDLLDSDHKILFNLVNQLQDAIETGQSRDVVGSVVNVLAEYVEHHFRHEEALMARARFPDIAAHQSQHRRLEDEVRDVRDRWLAGDRRAIGEEVLAFIRKWLTEHILVADKSYGPWVRALGPDAGIGCGGGGESAAS